MCGGRERGWEIVCVRRREIKGKRDCVYSVLPRVRERKERLCERETLLHVIIGVHIVLIKFCLLQCCLSISLSWLPLLPPPLGVLCLVGHLAISGKAPIPNVYNPEWIAAHGHVHRFCYLFFALMGERLKYYFAWKVAEGASILGGFGFEGYGTGRN